MKIAVWRTGHEIADTVADAVKEGIPNAEMCYIPPSQINAVGDVNIGYGILRGMDKVFRECERQGKPWINIDRGYFQPGHYDGHYRISLCGTQQTLGLDQLEPDYKRLGNLGIKFQDPYRINAQAHTLIVPPTDYVCDFFKVDKEKSLLGLLDMKAVYDRPYIIRHKGDKTPLGQHLTNCLRVVTFNSSVGWEALRRGIPVYSDPNCSIVGVWQKMSCKPLHLDLLNIYKLFAVMSSLQLTLSEIKSGMLCPLMEKLLKIHQSMSGSVSTQENQCAVMSPPIPSEKEQMRS